MVNLGLYIINSKGQKAFIGNYVKLKLSVQGWMGKDKTYEISDIRPDGTVILDGYIGQHISGIVDFSLVK